MASPSTEQRDAIARAYVDAFRAFHADVTPALADALDLAEAALLAAYGDEPGLYRLVKGLGHERSLTPPPVQTSADRCALCGGSGKLFILGAANVYDCPACASDPSDIRIDLQSVFERPSGLFGPDHWWHG